MNIYQQNARCIELVKWPRTILSFWFQIALKLVNTHQFNVTHQQLVVKDSVNVGPRLVIRQVLHQPRQKLVAASSRRENSLKLLHQQMPELQLEDTLLSVKRMDHSKLSSAMLPPTLAGALTIWLVKRKPMPPARLHQSVDQFICFSWIRWIYAPISIHEHRVYSIKSSVKNQCACPLLWLTRATTAVGWCWWTFSSRFDQKLFDRIFPERGIA